MYKQGLRGFSSYIPSWVPFPDERDNDDTLIEFAKKYLVPRAQVIYNLKTHHVEFLHKKLPRIVKESRREHAKLKKGRDYQFIAGATLIAVIAGGLEAAVASIGAATGLAAAADGVGLVAGVAEAGVAGAAAAGIADTAGICITKAMKRPLAAL